MFLPRENVHATLPLRLNQTIPRRLLPDNLKDVTLHVPLDEVVEECGEALDSMKASSLKRKQSEASEEEGNRRSRYVQTALRKHDHRP